METYSKQKNSIALFLVYFADIYVTCREVALTKLFQTLYIHPHK